MRRIREILELLCRRNFPDHLCSLASSAEDRWWTYFEDLREQKSFVLIRTEQCHIYIVLDIWVAIRSFISQRKWGFKKWKLLSNLSPQTLLLLFVHRHPRQPHSWQNQIPCNLFFPTGAFSSSHLISWKHSTKLSGSSGSPESWKRPITKSLRKFFSTIFLEYLSAKSANKENWNTGEDISSFLFNKSDYLSSSTSIDPPPSASKAVKIQLSWKKMKRWKAGKRWKD